MENDSSYFRILLRNVSSRQEDAISGICFEHHCLGISESLKFRQADRNYEPETVETESKCLEVYFASPPGETFLAEIHSFDSTIQIEVIEEPSKDWLEEWKKGFNEFELIPEVWVVPSWKSAPRQAKEFLWLDPGMAFGTGTHETTRIASQVLAGVLSAQPLVANTRVLDVGTGTAILAMLAEKLGAELVHGLDIDPQARRVARENLQRNKSKRVEILDESVESLQGQYDVVVANIIDGVLAQMQQHLKRLLKRPTGALILTGILNEREEIFKSEFFLPEGYEWRQRVELGEWVGYLVSPGVP